MEDKAARLFMSGVRNGPKLRVEICGTNDAHAILDLVDAFFETELAAAKLRH